MTVVERRIGRARVVFTDRHGGVSSGAFATGNLSTSVGDDVGAVTENRRRVAAHLGVVDPTAWVWLRQVHGNAVAVVDRAGAESPEADAAVTTARGVPLTVLTADCAPIALCTRDAIAVVHAGWHGLLAGVVEAGVDAIRDADPGAPVRAVLGPCVHAERYEFGVADLARVVERFGPSVRSHTADGRPALDIPATVRVALARAGVTDCDDVGVCTATSVDHFSHRRDGTTGRQALVVVLDP